MDLDLFLLIPVLIFSVVVHEVAHAWQARREGDDTAERLGRITLNPLPHLDFMGSFIVPVLLYLAPGGLLFGWAKPVPVDPTKFNDHPGSDIRVSLAGIISNLGLAVGFTLFAAAATAGATVLGGAAEWVVRGAYYGIFINLLLAFFNLLPIPPLDGSHVVANLLPPRAAVRYRELGRYGILAILALLYLVPGFFSLALAPVNWLLGLADAFVRLWG